MSLLLSIVIRQNAGQVSAGESVRYHMLTLPLVIMATCHFLLDPADFRQWYSLQLAYPAAAVAASRRESAHSLRLFNDFVAQRGLPLKLAEEPD